MCVNQMLATLAIGCLLEVQPRGFNVVVFESLIYEGAALSFKVQRMSCVCVSHRNVSWSRLLSCT